MKKLTCILLLALASGGANAYLTNSQLEAEQAFARQRAEQQRQDMERDNHRREMEADQRAHDMQMQRSIDEFDRYQERANARRERQNEKDLEKMRRSSLPGYDPWGNWDPDSPLSNDF